jgi:hypothetical protein
LLIRGHPILWRLAEGEARTALLSTLSERGVRPSRKVLAETSSFRKRKALSEAMLGPWILTTSMSTLVVPLLPAKLKCPHRPCRRRARAISVMASLTKVPFTKEQALEEDGVLVELVYHPLHEVVELRVDASCANVLGVLAAVQDNAGGQWDQLERLPVGENM